MKSIQLIYPTLSTIIDDLKYVQIGIERPHNIHIKEDFEWSAVVNINNIEYIITDRDILEFSDIGTLQLSVIDNSNPYLIIDLVYETAG